MKQLQIFPFKETAAGSVGNSEFKIY